MPIVLSNLSTPYLISDGTRIVISTFSDSEIDCNTLKILRFFISRSKETYMLKNTDRIRIRCVYVLPIEVPLSISFVEFGQVGLLDSHLYDLREVVLKIWQGMERLVEESLLGIGVPLELTWLVLIHHTLQLSL
jgi:hypothetical protein